MTLEKQVETAYAALLRTNEPEIAEEAIRLSTLLLDQPPTPTEEGSEETTQVPVPYVLLTVKRGQEAIPNSGIFECELMVEAGDNVTEASADGGRLDEIFRSAARALSYTDFKTQMSNATPNFLCYGMPERATGTEMNQEGSIVTRRITASLYCATAP